MSVLPAASMREKRQHERYAVNLPVNLRISREADWKPATLSNISRRGVFIRTDENSIVGTSVRVVFHSYDRGTYVPEGRILRVLGLPGFLGFAVRFNRSYYRWEMLMTEAERLPAPERILFLSSELRPRITVSPTEK